MQGIKKPQLPVINAVGLFHVIGAPGVQGEGSMLGQLPVLSEEPTLPKSRFENATHLITNAVFRN